MHGIADGVGNFGSDMAALFTGSQGQAEYGPVIEQRSPVRPSSGETPAAPPPSYRQLTQEKSGGSVRLYDLDKPAEQPATAVPAVSPYPAYGSNTGTPSHDPSVIVFPLDDGPPPEKIQRAPGTIPNMQPPTNARQPFQSPFGQIQPQGPSEMPPLASSGIYPAADPAGRIYFGHGSAAIDAAGKRTIGAVSRNARNNGFGSFVQVEGHASERTGIADQALGHVVNLKMSMERAMNVSRALIRDGVPANRVATTAWGDTHPPTLVQGKDPEAAARRVEIFATAIGR